jgi:hypothetical protein
MVEAGESKYSRVLKIRKLLISRPAKSGVYAKIGRVAHWILRKFLPDRGARGEDTTFVIHRGVKRRGCPTFSVGEGGRFFSDAEKSETSLRKRRSAFYYV